MAVIAALIAGFVALLIAFVAYPHQKKVDRALKLAEEKRLAYQHFFSASEDFFAKLRTAAFENTKPLPDDEFSRLEVAKTEIAFRAGEAAASACADLSQHLKDYRKYIKLCRSAPGQPTESTTKARDDAYRKVNSARVFALLAAREDAKIDLEHPASEETIKRLFMMLS